MAKGNEIKISRLNSDRFVVSCLVTQNVQLQTCFPGNFFQHWNINPIFSAVSLCNINKNGITYELMTLITQTKVKMCENKRRQTSHLHNFFLNV